MCECVEYDDGSLYLCPVDADIHLETEKQRNQAIALLREFPEEERYGPGDRTPLLLWYEKVEAYLEGGDEG